MQTVTLYHGTCADNLESIRENGFNGLRGRQLWKCSAGLNYFWNAGYFEDYPDDAKIGALGNSEVSLVRAKDCRRLLFKLEVPQSYFEENFQEDNSCSNMGGAVLSTQPVPFDFVTQISRDFQDLSFLRPHFAYCARYNGLSLDELTTIEQIMVESINPDCRCLLDDLLRDLDMEIIYSK